MTPRMYAIICSVGLGLFGVTASSSAASAQTVPLDKSTSSERTEPDETRRGDRSRDESHERKTRGDRHRRHNHHHRHHHHRYHHRHHHTRPFVHGPRIFVPGEARENLDFEFDRIWVSVDDEGVRVDYAVDRWTWTTCKQPARGVYLTLFVENQHGYKFRYAVPLPVRLGHAMFREDFGIQPGDKVGVGVVMVGPMISGPAVYPGYVVHQPTLFDVHADESRLSGDSAELQLKYYGRMRQFPWFATGYGFGFL